MTNKYFGKNRNKYWVSAKRKDTGNVEIELERYYIHGGS